MKEARTLFQRWKALAALALIFCLVSPVRSLGGESEAEAAETWTIAIFGYFTGNSDRDLTSNLDTALIVTVNRQDESVSMESVDPEMILHAGPGQTLGNVYAEGGGEQAALALSREMGIPEVDYVCFDWKAVADGINLMGGTDLELTPKEYAWINAWVTQTVRDTGIASAQIKHDGLNHIDGVGLVAYGRLIDDSGVKELARKEQVLTIAWKQAMQSDLYTRWELMKVVYPLIVTSLDSEEIQTLLELGDKKY